MVNTRNSRYSILQLLRLTSINVADTSNMYSLALLSAASFLVGKRSARYLTRGMKKEGVQSEAKVQKVGTDF